MSNYPIWQKYAYEKEPDIELLEKALENDGLLVDKEHSLKAIELKYQAMTTEPTIIEKTMSPKQLFDAGSPLWASGYTVQELYSYMRYDMPVNDYNTIEFIIQSAMYKNGITSSALKLIKNTACGAT
jgi:hypothetical protein